jgi:hypothetical protein
MKNKFFFNEPLTLKKKNNIKFNRMWKKWLRRNIKKYTSNMDIHGFSHSYITRKQMYLWSNSLHNIKTTLYNKTQFYKLNVLKKIIYYIKNIHSLYCLLFKLYYPTLLLKKKNGITSKNNIKYNKNKFNNILKSFKKLIYSYIYRYKIVNYKKIIKLFYIKLIKYYIKLHLSNPINIIYHMRVLFKLKLKKIIYII